MMKNLDVATVLTLRDQVAYQPGQVVSKTLAQNDAVSVTLFAFDKDEEISTHESGGDALVTCLDGVGRVWICFGWRWKLSVAISTALWYHAKKFPSRRDAYVHKP